MRLYSPLDGGSAINGDLLSRVINQTMVMPHWSPSIGGMNYKWRSQIIQDIDSYQWERPMVWGIHLSVNFHIYIYIFINTWFWVNCSDLTPWPKPGVMFRIQGNHPPKGQQVSGGWKIIIYPDGTLVINGGFLSHGGTPIAGWFIIQWMIWGYHVLTVLENLRIFHTSWQIMGVYLIHEVYPSLWEDIQPVKFMVCQMILAA